MQCTEEAKGRHSSDCLLRGIRKKTFTLVLSGELQYLLNKGLIIRFHGLNIHMRLAFGVQIVLAVIR